MTVTDVLAQLKPWRRAIYAALAVVVVGVGALIWAALPDDVPADPVTPAATCGTGETVDPATGECIPATTPPSDGDAGGIMPADIPADDLGQKPRCGKCLVPCLVGSHHDCDSCNGHECSDTDGDAADPEAIHWPGCVSQPFCWPPELLDQGASYPDWPWCKLTGDCAADAADVDAVGKSPYARCLSACLDTLHCGSYDRNRRACGQACIQAPHDSDAWPSYCDSADAGCDAG